MPTNRENPFVGPRPLSRSDGIYGREQELRELQWFFTAERIVWLHAPSGAGKTSLIQAGLIPGLEADDFEVLPTIRVNGPAEPGVNRYEASVLACLNAHSNLRDYLAATAGAKSRVLIFDQFEEVVTLDPTDVSEKEVFFQSLGKALELRDIWALFVIREDYLPALHSYVRFIPTMMNHRFRLDLLTVANAREAMERIAQNGGRTFTQEASKQLAKELALVRIAASEHLKEGYFVEPVILQVVCRSMWAELLPPDGRTIELSQTPSGKKLEEALATYYAICVSAASCSSGTQERRIRNWIDEKLIVAGIRKQAVESDADVEGLPASTVDDLVKTHLIRREPRGERTWYELAHDRLIQPILDDNVRFQNNLPWFQRRADLWLLQDRSKAVLLSDQELADAKDWIANARPILTPDEQAFLARSLEEQGVRKKIRRRTRAAWIFAGVATLAFVIAFVSREKEMVRGSINLSLLDVRGSTVKAGDAVAAGLDALNGAEYLGQELRRDSMEALSEALQGRPPYREVASGVVKLSLYPASAATKLAVVSSNTVTLFQLKNALDHDPTVFSSWTFSEGCVTQVSFSPDGAQIWFGLGDGTTRPFAVAASDAPTMIPCTKDGSPVEALAVSSAGVASASSAGIKIDNQLRSTRQARALAFRSDGKLLAAGLRDGTVQILDLNGTEVKTLTLGDGEISSLAWGPGVLAAVSRFLGKLGLWDDSYSNLREGDLASPQDGFAGVAVSPDGTLVAAIGFGENHETKVWQTGSTEPPLVLRVPPNSNSYADLSAVAFFDNTHLLVADSLGTVRMFPLDYKGLREAADCALREIEADVVGRPLQACTSQP